VEEADVKMPVWERPVVWRLGKMVGIGLLGLMGLIFLLRLTRRSTSNSAAVAMIKPGARVRELEANMRSGEAWELVAEDNTVALRERARELSKADPGKAAHLLKAWVDSDIEASREAKESAVV
jgi:flagellar biosynthesis/type III secretory pathway M-ring protein FliF/YscJ